MEASACIRESSGRTRYALALLNTDVLSHWTSALLDLVFSREIVGRFEDFGGCPLKSNARKDLLQELLQTKGMMSVPEGIKAIQLHISILAQKEMIYKQPCYAHMYPHETLHNYSCKIHSLG